MRAVTLDVRDPYVALFVAPEVAGDTLIRLSVGVEDVNDLIAELDYAFL